MANGVRGKKDVETLTTLKDINQELNKQRSLRDKNAASQETEKDRVKYILELEKQRKAITTDINKETKSVISLNKTINSLKKDAIKAEEATNKSILSRISAIAKGNVLEAFGVGQSKEHLDASRKLANEAVKAAKGFKDLANNNKISKGQAEGLAQISSDISAGITTDNDEIKDRIKNLGVEGDIGKNALSSLQDVNKKQKISSELGKASAARAARYAKMIGIAGAGFAVLKSIAEKFAAVQDAIGKQFGSLVSLTDGVEENLLNARIEAGRLGASIDDVVTATDTLSSEFGLGTVEASALAGKTIDISKAIGLSVGETSKLIGTLMTTSGLSFQQAEQLAEGANQLANMNNVNPSAVLKDMAGSAEAFAQFSKDGGENLAQAAVQARAMGMSLDETAKMARGLLNFQESITAEVEASVLIGRQLNLQKAREAALDGNMTAFRKEITKQVGSEAEFNKLNVFQREALAKALNTDVVNLSKMVATQDKLNTGTEQSVKSFRDLLGKEGISNLTELTNNLKTFGAIVVNTLGPVLSAIVGSLNFALTLGGLVNTNKPVGVSDIKTSPGGIKYMTGPAGTFELNPRDSVLATTNPIKVNEFGANGTSFNKSDGTDVHISQRLITLPGGALGLMIDANTYPKKAGSGRTPFDSVTGRL
tara:strand:- start:225 stop:2186 length:1962 start_codon:yes stop_codon:yes gene_type:complete